MKTKLFFLALALLGCATQIPAQLDTLFTLHVANFDPTGFVYYNPNTLVPGQALELYKTLSGDTANDLPLYRQWEDSLLHMQHYRYRQTYKGLRVEAAEYTEHAANGSLVFANGKLVPNLNADPAPTLSEAEALSALLATLPNHTFAWDDDAWELQIQLDTGDSAATFYPNGELLWGIDNYRDLGCIVSPNRYRLAWEFKIFRLQPNFHKAFFVDAHTGEVFRESNLVWHNGPASIWNHGTQTIDTKPTGNQFKLHADDNDRDIHTKNFGTTLGWWTGGEVKDGDDIWGPSDQDETSTHWFVTQSWDYFKSTFGRNGMDELGSQVRVYADLDSNTTGFYFEGNHQYIDVFEAHARTLDIVAHEFTHGVTQATAELQAQYESGALGESFSDIFGVLIEHYTAGYATDWTIGENSLLPNDIRSLINPSAAGLHYPGSNCLADTGQPDTYQGNFWYTGTCDDGGIHTNDGVQNFWFYLLSEGGAGINDHNDNYSIQGLGSYNAARIAYWSLTNILQSGAQYADARQASISAARYIFGNCSNEEIQCTNAWHAVGVGTLSNCPSTSMSSATVEVPSIHPNPSTGMFLLRFPTKGIRQLKVTSMLGEVVWQENIRNEIELPIDLSTRPSGLYFLNVQDRNGSKSIKLVKQ